MQMFCIFVEIFKTKTIMENVKVIDNGNFIEVRCGELGKETIVVNLFNHQWDENDEVQRVYPSSKVDLIAVKIANLLKEVEL